MRSCLLAILTLATACGVDPMTSGDDTGSSTPPSGEALFQDTCARCHGPDARGTSDGPQILSAVAGYATYVVRNGRAAEMGFPTGMDAIDAAELPDADLGLILAWLDSADKPTTGPDLYNRYCQNCHGADGRTGRVGKNIVREAGELSQIVRAGHGGHYYAYRTSYMPSWTATEISDADLALLRTYVSSL